LALVRRRGSQQVQAGRAAAFAAVPVAKGHFFRKVRSMKRFRLAAVLLAFVLGCAEAGEHAAKTAEVPPNVQAPPAKQKPQPSGELSRRKIIYNGSLDLLVDNLSEATARLEKLVQDHQALLADSEINNTLHAHPSATWRVRVPVDMFADFVKQAAKLGEALRDKTDSQDITEKYFDYQVRIDNKKVQVDRLQKIIKDQTGKISELLEAERELNRVTTELEQLKGTVKLWDNQVAMATVEIVMHERQQYAPPVTASFASSVSRTFYGSLDNLIAFAEAVTLVVVALVPWTPVIALFVAGLWLLARRTSPRSRLGSETGKPAG
jgi:Domain of unknown function (DUF4349)